ncbi:MAG: class I tRNA ligase family protein, partial [Candidatus Roizmanbacteria bacterium]|nr:class I tRNA ligase family protein [Candidatus Roizmanbacteria bacterium]
MDSKYQPQLIEEKIYKEWEEKGLLKPSSDEKPFTILMPPPNANASLHAGHGMYVVDDIMIRYKRLRGYASLWIPGIDHAGFETQYVYEKYLAKQGKSRFDFSRQTLYENIYQFVRDNSGLIYSQLKKLGFLADWKRSVFTLDKHVLETVLDTFIKMEKEGYVYKDEYIVNYCTHCGTSLSELET